MLSNFRRRFLDSPSHQGRHPLVLSRSDASDADYLGRMNDTVAQRHWVPAMAETVCVAGCTCTFCSRLSEIDDDADPAPTPGRTHLRNDHHTPSTRSIMQVLYPPSCPDTSLPFPDPPSYSLSDAPARRDDAEISLLTSSATSIEGTPLSRSPPDPLAQDPSLTGVPYQSTSSRVPPADIRPPIIALVSGDDLSEETEPLPAYSRFDQRRPRFPVASDVLGPYPPLSVLCQAAR